MGLQGAGKSTLATALANSFDDYNSALVVCPMHADDAEIRRKILVQLLSNPLFDDEVPLADTILRLAPSLSKPLHIIIDDAHFLSKSLWAECIILSQLHCAGRAIAITVTSLPEFVAGLMSELTESHRKQLLQITLEPLSCVEREGLYYSLLTRSERNPFTPREIVRSQLEKQTGTPAAVVVLLNLALHGEQESSLAWWHKYMLPLIIGLALVISLPIAWFYFPEEEAEPSVTHDTLAITALRQQWLIEYGNRLLVPYFVQRQMSFKEWQLNSISEQSTELATHVVEGAKEQNASLIAGTRDIQVQDGNIPTSANSENAVGTQEALSVATAVLESKAEFVIAPPAEGVEVSRASNISEFNELPRNTLSGQVRSQEATKADDDKLGQIYNSTPLPVQTSAAKDTTFVREAEQSTPDTRRVEPDPSTEVITQGQNDKSIATASTDKQAISSLAPAILTTSDLMDTEQVDSSLETRPPYSTAIRYPNGYTIQVALVKKRDTVQRLLLQLTHVASVKVAQRNQHWIVLIGDYPDFASAQLGATELPDAAKLGEPWLRKWSTLSDYQLLATIPVREISE